MADGLSRHLSGDAITPVPPPPVPSPPGRGFCAAKVGEPPDGGRNGATSYLAIRNSLALMLFLVTPPRPSP